ncbi:MAG: hypothetical protein JW822_03805 [Spirochaetales bacterium]|nr:hypothetical protein [Spirochaetales bacterium]
MKIIVIILLLTSTFVSADSIFDNFYIGEYAFYFDLRDSENPHYTGFYFVRFKNSEAVTFFVRTINLNTFQETRYDIELIEKDRKPKLVNMDCLLGQETNYTRQTSANVLNFLVLYNDNKENIEIDNVIADYWPEFGYTLHYTVNTYAPLFRLKHMIFEKEKEPRYFLDRGGYAPDSPDEFLNIKPFHSSQTNRGQPWKEIVEKEMRQIEINGVIFELDDNWQQHTTPVNPSYWLSLAVERDSIIFIDQNNVPNINRKTFYLQKKSTEIIVFSFCGFAAMYYNNEAYYDRILNSVHLKE